MMALRHLCADADHIGALISLPAARTFEGWSRNRTAFSPDIAIVDHSPAICSFRFVFNNPSLAEGTCNREPRQPHMAWRDLIGKSIRSVSSARPCLPCERAKKKPPGGWEAQGGPIGGDTAWEEEEGTHTIEEGSRPGYWPPGRIDYQ